MGSCWAVPSWPRPRSFRPAAPVVGRDTVHPVAPGRQPSAPPALPCAEAERPPHKGPSSRCQRSPECGQAAHGPTWLMKQVTETGPLVSFKSQHQTSAMGRTVVLIQGHSQREAKQLGLERVLRGPGGRSAFQQRLQRAATHQAAQTAVPAASSTESSRTPSLQLVFLRQCNPGQVPS